MVSVVDQVPFNEYPVVDGATTVFPYEFQLLDAGDLIVYVNAVEVPSSTFTLSGVGNQTGGNVTFSTAPAAGSDVLLVRLITLARDTDYQYNGDLREATLDRDFNRIWQVLQEFRSQIGGTVRAPYPERLTELPPASVRANTLLAFDAQGNPTISVPISGSAADVLAMLADSTPTNGDARIAVLKKVAGAYPTTQDEINERSFHLVDFMTDVEKLLFFTGPDNSFNATPAFVRMRAAARLARVKTMRFFGKVRVDGIMSADGMRSGIPFPMAPSLNADPMDQLVLEGEGGGSVITAGMPNMIVLRASGNFTWFRNFTVDGAGLSNVWCIGAVPEDMTQTTVLTNQSHFWCDDVNTVNADEGIVFMPGPRVAGADSGAFYNRVRGGYSNFVKRAHWSRKGPTWAVDVNRITRTIISDRVVTRANCAYHFEVGSEIVIRDCNDEFVNRPGPLATPTAMRIEAACSNITRENGYSEACTESVFLEAHNLTSRGYQPLSGSDLLFNRWALAYDSATGTRRQFVPLVAFGTSGATSSNTSTGVDTQRGLQHIGRVNVAFDKGTGTGQVVFNGFPFLADSSLAGNQGMEVLDWTGVTFPATAVKLCARMSGAATLVLFFSTNGGGTIALQDTHLASSVTMTLAYEVEGA